MKVLSNLVFLIVLGVAQMSFAKIFVATDEDKHPPRPVPLNQELIKELKRATASLVSERVGDYILRAGNLVESQKYDKAIDLLDYHYKRKKELSDLERAHLALHLASIYRQIEVKGDKKAEKVNRDKALTYFQTALDSGTLDHNSYMNCLYHTVELHAEATEMEKSFVALKKWFSINKKPHPTSYILLAGLYLSQNNLDEGLKYIEYALSIASQPKEGWLQFAVAIHIQKKNYKKAQSYLERLVALFPGQAQHWTQLAGVYLLQNDNKKAFVTLDVAYKMGYVKKKRELLNLASLYIDQEMPYQSGKVMEKGIQAHIIPKEKKTLELQAEAFYLAREGEKSLRSLKAASQVTQDPKFFLKYGQRLLHEEKWVEAEAVFRKVLDFNTMKRNLASIQNYKKKLAQSKKLKSIDQRETRLIASNKNLEKDTELKAPPTAELEKVYLYLGIALYSQDKTNKALASFNKAIEIDDTYLDAYQWIDFTEGKLSETKQAGL